MSFTAIRTPVGALTRRVHVGQSVRAAWPGQPDALHALLTGALCSPYARSDHLLWLADALAEAATHAGAHGHLTAKSGLTALRYLLQEAAPDRVDPPLTARVGGAIR